MFNTEMYQDLDRYVCRLKKGISLEREYRDDLYEFIYSTGFPDIEFLKMGRA